jgi:hypothetical protein
VSTPRFVHGVFLALAGWPEAARPQLQKPVPAGVDAVVAGLFYLPERMSTDPKWLQFWDQPEYQELFNIRRSHPYDKVSYWKERPSPSI